MKNILILASGDIARHFIEWISKNRVAENHYHAMCYKAGTTPPKIGKNITLVGADPTSFAKLSNTMREVRFSNIFIVMEDLEDTKFVLKNLSIIKSKSRIVLVNQWDDPDIGTEQEGVTIVHTASLLAAHLYDQLPNVPLIAQNVGHGRGEIMEVHVPFGSAYAYRHVGSVMQRKWKIAALYRETKQILPNNATMIRPNDTLLLVGKPMVLDGVYKSINKRMGLFPEPFGKDIYLILDFRHDKKEILRYISEAMFLLEKLDNKLLYVRIIYPNDFQLLEEVKQFESEKVSFHICYGNDEINGLIEYDINEYNIGLILSSIPAFEADGLKETLYDLKKLVYLFGKQTLFDIKECIVLMSENEKMESISTTAFDLCETFDLHLTLGDFDPEGDFETKSMVIEHYETLTHIFNMEINIEQKIANPIRTLSLLKDVIQVAPFEKNLTTNRFKKFLSSRVQDFLLTTNRHPKLLVPFVLSEEQAKIG